MIYWENIISLGRWVEIKPDDLSPEGNDARTVVQQCADYCRYLESPPMREKGYECLGFYVTREDPSAVNLDGPIIEKCYINPSGMYMVQYPKCWGSTCNPKAPHYPSNYQTITFGVFRDYYQTNPQNLPTDEPDGTLGTYQDEGFCEKINTSFGKVNYRKTDGIAFTPDEYKNVIREDGEPGSNCAARCFEKAGCSAFYAAGSESCYFIIGFTNGGQENDNISESGMLNSICPDTALNNSWIRRSQFYRLVFSPDQLESVSDQLVADNSNSDTSLHKWTFKTRSNNPMVSVSQYISVTDVDLIGNSRRKRGLYFNIETHVRTGINQSARRRRREADDIIAIIEETEQQATSFILDGGMKMPAGVEVVATSPIEVVEFVQAAADGSVVADCSSGSCECSPGFVDNGNGCEEMAAPTQAPTTGGATPTVKEFSEEQESNQVPVVSNQVPAAENDCGECWEADENGNCVPEPGRVTTICGPNSIKMAIESCVFSGKYNHEDVFVGTEDADSSCKLSFDGSYGWPAYSLEHGLTDCGMSMVHDSENGSIIFQVSFKPLPVIYTVIH